MSFDHTEYLGDTLGEIAAEKAGIIKKNALVLTGCTGEVLSVIERKSRGELLKMLQNRGRFHLQEKRRLEF